MGDGAADRRRLKRHSAVAPSPTLAALLSLLWPGLGQFYLGRTWRGWMLFVPAALSFAAAVVWLASSLGNLTAAALAFLDPARANLLLGFIALSALLRIVSVLDAGFAIRNDRRSAAGMGVALAAVAALLAGHGAAAIFANSILTAAAPIFVSGEDPAAVDVSGPASQPSDSPDPASPHSGSPEPVTSVPVESGDPEPGVIEETAGPGTTPRPVVDAASWPDDDRLTALVVGVDSAPGRSHALTDTMIVVSIDRETGETAMVSLPRDIANFPLSTGGTYRGKINSLRDWAARNPGRYPDGGMAGLMTEVGYLIGLRIDHYAVVDLAGFKRAVDLVGGVEVDNPRAIDDPSYGYTDGRPSGLSLPAGPVQLDGEMALAYVRTRKGAGDSDFTRAARQQQILLALRQKLTDPGMLPRLPELVGAAAEIIRTSYPASEIGQAFQMAQWMDAASDRVVLGPPYSHHPPSSSTGGSWTLKLDLDRVAVLSRELFGADSRYAGS